MAPEVASTFFPNHEFVRRCPEILDLVLSDATTLIGVGEAAHFVSEFNRLRVQLVRILIERYGVSHIALEVGFDEASQIESWFQSRAECDLEKQVGPLTLALYGSLLVDLRAALGPAAAQLSIVGVDLPNSLTLGPSLVPLARLIERHDPDATDLVDAARNRAAAITGASAAASAFSWLALRPDERDALTVSLARLSARIEALEPLYRESGSRENWLQAMHLARTAVTTDLMLRVMGELFNGTGRSADTTLRERYIARELLSVVDRLPTGSRVAYIAHNNHIQKTQVRYFGALTALPAGLFLARSLGGRFVSLALTHLGDTVPEMSVPAPNVLGFDVVEVPVEPPAENSLEAAARLHAEGEGTVCVLPRRAKAGSDSIRTIRSQSAISEAPFAESFDVAFVCPTATLDPAVSRIVATL